MPPRRAAAATKPFPSSNTTAETDDRPAAKIPAKRKSADILETAEDGHAKKRAKQGKVAKPKAGTSKALNGEQVAGGLFIIRGAPPPPPVGEPSTVRLHDLPPPPERRPARRSSPPPREPSPSRGTRKASATKKPPTGLGVRSGRAPAAPAPAKSAKARGKERAVEPEEVSDEVRNMVQELSDLTVLGREQARKAGPPTPHHPDLTFAPRKSYSLAPPPSPSSYRPPPAPSHDFLDAQNTADSVQPLPIRDTPMISKNREMRKEAQQRRRSSWGMRGKRTSSMPGEMPAQPHPSLPHGTFYKHMSQEDPPALRMRNLLLWTSLRAGQVPPTPPQAAGRRTRSKGAPPVDPPLPELPPDADTILKEVEEEIARLLSANKVDTRTYLHGGGDSGGQKRKANEQNARNREREEADLAYIERCKQEDATWSTLIQSYNTHQSTVVKAITVQNGKRHAETSWRPRLNELDDRWRKIAEDAEHEVLDDRVQEERELEEKFAALEVKVDSLHQSTHIFSQLAERSSTHLASHLQTLQIRHQARSVPLPPLTAPSNSNSNSHPSAPLSALLSAIRPEARATTAGGQDDPQLLFRALATKDVERQRREEEGDTDAQRRREDVADRRVTAVPPTPRRGQGTPGRRSTPGKGKR